MLRESAAKTSLERLDDISPDITTKCGGTICVEEIAKSFDNTIK